MPQKFVHRASEDAESMDRLPNARESPACKFVIKKRQSIVDSSFARGAARRAPNPSGFQVGWIAMEGPTEVFKRSTTQRRGKNGLRRDKKLPKLTTNPSLEVFL